MDPRTERLVEQRRSHRRLLRGVPDDIVRPLAATMATAVNSMPPHAERNVAEHELRRYLDDVLLRQRIEVELPDRLPSVGDLRAVNEATRLVHLLSAGWRIAERTVGLGHVQAPLAEVREGVRREFAEAAERLAGAIDARREEAVHDGAQIGADAWLLTEVRSFVIAALLADRFADDGYIDERDPRRGNDDPDGVYL